MLEWNLGSHDLPEPFEVCLTASVLLLFIWTIGTEDTSPDKGKAKESNTSCKLFPYEVLS